MSDTAEKVGDKKVDLESKVGDSKLVTEIKERTRYAIRGQVEWAQNARNDYDFALGDQWTPEERQILENQGRPVLTYNLIGAIVNALCGHQRKNSSRIRVNPEGGEDELFTEISDHIVRHFDKTAHLKEKMDYQFDDGVICGKGWGEVSREYNDDPIYGRLCIRSSGPWSIFPDPNAKEYDLSDAQYCVKVVRLSKATLKQMFPDQEEKIDRIEVDSFDPLGEVEVSIDKDDYQNKTELLDRSGTAAAQEADTENDEDRKFTLVEYWHRKREHRFYFFNTVTGRIEEFEKEEEADAKLEKVSAGISQQIADLTLVDPMADTTPFDSQLAVMKVQKRKVSRMHVAIMVGDIILQPVELSPLEPRWHDFPFVPFYGWWTPSAQTETLRVKGIVRDLVDPQRDLNKSRSQFLHIINTSANSGWIGDEDALSKEGWDALERMGSKPGITVKKKTGKQLDRITPVPAPMAQQIIERMDDESFKKISGINADLLSVEDSANPSGRALGIRINQALTIVAKPFSNWQLTKELMGNLLISIIPDMVDVNRIKKILGEKFIAENQLTDALLTAYLAQIEDRRFNVWVSEADNSPTIRAETFEQLIELAKSGADIPIEIILEFSSIPNLGSVLKKIEEYRAKQAAAAQAAQGKQGPPAPAGPATPPG